MSEINLDDKAKKKLLKEAQNSHFSMGLNDIGSKLCKANVCYGLSKIKWMQKELGMEPDATFISGPDETISRNRDRWQSGFGYGGKVTWGNGKDPIIILNVMVNACGMLLGSLEDEPDVEVLLQRLRKLHEEDTYIEDLKVEWDLGKSNHFVDIFKVVSTADEFFPQYAFIIHAGAPEIKGDNARGMGLYYRKSKIIQDKYIELKTPFDNIYYLDGDDAREYYEFFQLAKRFSMKRREYAAEKLFDNYKIISSTMHQTLPNMNEILLGSHDVSDAELFPVTLRADRPAFIMRPKDNLTEEVIEYLNFTARAEELGMMDRLKSANILPHGGGYTFPFLNRVKKVFEIDNTRYFVISLVKSKSRKVIADLREIQYRYRDERIIERTLELELGKVVARLEPQFVLKI
ncbi:MAG: hypothetical protein JSV49_12555 [Thermoplasmata archaeon]|nr:MAG: hypothetical protein JSV49_12555 [Thermoplasmata archaeon]